MTASETAAGDSTRSETLASSRKLATACSPPPVGSVCGEAGKLPVPNEDAYERTPTSHGRQFENGKCLADNCIAARYRSLGSVGASSAAIDAIQLIEGATRRLSESALGTSGAKPGSPEGSIITGILHEIRCDILCVTDRFAGIVPDAGYVIGAGPDWG